MSKNEDLYKRVAPLWFVGGGCSLFAGSLTYNALHSHSTSIYLAGLYEPFLMRLTDTDWMVCRAAVVPSGVAYELDVRGNPLAVCYLEPNIAGIEALLPLLGTYEEIGGALIGRYGETHLLRELYEDDSALEWADEALSDLIDFSKEKARVGIDPRISHVVQSLYDNPVELNSLSDVIREVGLSSSRFQHVFTNAMGIPFRRYRAWHRLRAAIQEVIDGENLTTAAHSAGYFDQAHFSRHFRNTFGAPPRKSLSKVR